MVAPAQPTYVYPSPYGPPVYAQPPVIVVTPAPPMADWHLSATVDALFLERSVGSSIPLGFTAYNSASNLPPAVPTGQLYSDDAQFPLAAGLRLELTTKLDDRWSISGMFWGLQQWSVGNTIYADPDQDTVLAYSPYLQLPYLLNGMDDSLTYKYDSKIENVEFNASYRLNAYDPYFELDWVVGARYVYVSDHFTLTGIDDFNSATETLDYATSNNLIGAQTGLLLVRGWSRFQYELGFKLGLMANIYHQRGSDSASELLGHARRLRTLQCHQRRQRAGRLVRRHLRAPLPPKRESLVAAGLSGLRHHRPGLSATSTRQLGPRRKRRLRRPFDWLAGNLVGGRVGQVRQDP